MGIASRRLGCLGRRIRSEPDEPVKWAGSNYPRYEGNEPEPSKRRGWPYKCQREESQAKTDSDDPIHKSFVILEHDVLQFRCGALRVHHDLPGMHA